MKTHPPQDWTGLGSWCGSVRTWLIKGNTPDLNLLVGLGIKIVLNFTNDTFKRR